MPYLPGSYTPNARPLDAAAYPGAGSNAAYPYRPQAPGGSPREATPRAPQRPAQTGSQAYAPQPSYPPAYPSAYPPSYPPAYQQPPYAARVQPTRPYRPQADERRVDQPSSQETAPRATLTLSTPISGWKAWPILLRVSGVALSALFALSGLWFGFYLIIDVQPFYGTLVLLLGLLLALFVMSLTVIAVRLLRHISR